MSLNRLTRAALGVAGAFAVSAALAVPAHAVSVVPTTECATPVITQPFAEWGDGNWYKRVDGGAFEEVSAGWTLTGGATVADGVLSLPAGASAVSAPVCVGHDEPTLRFFGAGQGGLTVAIQFQLLPGLWITLPVGRDTGAAWKPSPIIHMLANYLPAPGDYTNVRFVFTPSGDWQIDDVYVDPRARA
ncbi:hypothetical protein OJ997_26610 [Solirubrobacter phytolaccae]|uniref:Uncharacterized protein n=1 Tax=Solirubrobacter phytolaccae TaxID=1404360 RepID=A0A9X3NFB1_9ACTN|nr:hypothetical protein [Solirubrobacter phytolaccae]MDA0183907.1 hypothetical protein [Solirubrobacter phytolaccae]